MIEIHASTLTLLIIFALLMAMAGMYAAFSMGVQYADHQNFLRDLEEQEVTYISEDGETKKVRKRVTPNKYDGPNEGRSYR